MKNRILSFILVVVMALSAVAPMVVGAAEINYVTKEFNNDNEKLETMGEPIAKSPNGVLELYLDEGSGEMAIKNTKTCEIALTNPYDLSKSGMIASDIQIALSQLYLNYTVISSNTPVTLYSYKDCIKFNQAEFTPLEDGSGVKVHYLLGEQVVETIIPFKISMEAMHKAIESLTKNEQDKVLSVYIAYNPNEVDENGNYVLPESARQKYLEKYPLSGEIPLYVLRNVNEDFSTVISLLTKANYTIEQKKADYELVKEDTDEFVVESRPAFEIDATYQITNDGFVATVDASSLKYDDKLYYVNSVSLLPYFEAAWRTEGDNKNPRNCEKGYVFLPDGSGSLVDFEELLAERTQVSMVFPMYGNDYAYYKVTEKNTENCTMPVFGLVNETQASGYFAVIETGDSIALVNSEHSLYYNSVYPSFKITPVDTYDLADSFSSGTTSSKEVKVTSSELYKGECKVKYFMLTDEEKATNAGLKENEYYDNTYVGMAECYRDYLGIKKLTSEDINKDYTKLFLEVFGSMKVEEKIATFPVTVNKELTTFEDVKNIYGELTNEGVGNLSFVLKGFANGGLTSTYPTELKWQKVLGGSKGFVELLKFAEGKFEVVPDVEFSYSYGSTMFGSYNHKEHGVRTLDNRYTTKRNYYAATQTFERTGGVAVSSASFEYLYNKFYSDLSKYEIKSLAVRTLGSDLNSDFDKENFYNREDSKNNVVAMLKVLKGDNGNKKDYSLVLDAGNSYAMAYADAVLAVSLDSSRRKETSVSVPFYGIVYHGSVEFAGNAFNMEGDTEYMFLKAIENGASLYFTIAKQNVELLKFDKNYSKYYSVSYDNLKSTIVDTYKAFNDLMKNVQLSYIVDHEFLNNGEAVRYEGERKIVLADSLVIRVEYENGNGFILNYHDEAVEVTLPYVNGGKPVKVDRLGCVPYTVEK